MTTRLNAVLISHNAIVGGTLKTHDTVTHLGDVEVFGDLKLNGTTTTINTTVKESSYQIIDQTADHTNPALLIKSTGMTFGVLVLKVQDVTNGGTIVVGENCDLNIGSGNLTVENSTGNTVINGSLTVNNKTTITLPANKVSAFVINDIDENTVMSVNTSDTTGTTTFYQPTLITNTLEISDVLTCDGNVVVNGGVIVTSNLDIYVKNNSSSSFRLYNQSTSSYPVTIDTTTDNNLASINIPLKVSSSGDSSSSSTGCAVFSGGIGVAKNIYAGSSIYQSGYLLMPTGVILPYANSSAPSGFLLCDGSAISRTTYSVLFAVISTTFGSGNGVTTFNLPDMRGKMVMGTSSSYTYASTGGNASVTLATNNLPSFSISGTTDNGGLHTHSVNDSGHSHGTYNGRDDGNCSNVSGQAPPGDSFDNIVSGYGTATAYTGVSLNNGGTHTHTFSASYSGSDQSFSILNPYMSLAYIIKY